MVRFGFGKTIPDGSQFDTGDDGRLSIRTDLILELYADTGIILNGADVSDWTDQSGQVNTIVQTVAVDQPLYNATDANYGTINSSVEFNAEALHRGVTGLCQDLDGTDTPFTVVAAMEIVGTVGAGTIFLCKDGSGNARHMQLNEGSPARYRGFHRDDTPTTNDKSSDANQFDEDTPLIMAWEFDGSSSTVWENKVIVPGLSSVAHSTGGNKTLDAFVVGARDTNGGGHRYCKIAAMVVYKAALGQTNVFTVSDDLNTLTSIY